MNLLAQQYVNIVNLNSSYYPTGEFKDNSPLKTVITKPAFNLRIPIVLKNEDVILLGVNGLLLDSKKESSSVSDDRLIATNAYAGIQHIFSDSWSAVFLGLFKVNSDFHSDIDSDQFIPSGLVLATYKWKKDIDLKAGWYYGQEFFGAFTFPLIGLNWRINEKMFLSATLPSIAELEYELSKYKLYTGLRYQRQTESFRLTESGNYVKFTEMNMRAFLDAYLTKNIVAYIGAGINMDRKYNEYIKDKEDIDEWLAVFSALPWKGPIKGVTPMIEAGVAFRVRLDRQEE